MTTTTELTVTLEHGPNIDIMHDERAGYWAPPIDPPQMLVNVTGIADAVSTFCAWRERNELGGGNMTRRCGFIITDNGTREHEDNQYRSLFNGSY